MVELMETHPDVGIIQTVPVAVSRRSLFARVQQFASRVYGPMFSAGLHFWQLGDGQYWGHNAIVRTRAVHRSTARSPRLPGKPPLGGEILSHDFVEAALDGSRRLDDLARLRPRRLVRGGARRRCSRR